jgi:hypothetical protein
VVSAAIALAIFSFHPQSAVAQQVLTPGEAAQAVAIKNLQSTPTEVTGVIVNNTQNGIRDVEILIAYHWLWANEFKPGLDSPGRIATVRIGKELSPGESTEFRYVPNPPLPNRQDGRFDPEVVVAGFTRVIPATTASR